MKVFYNLLLISLMSNLQANPFGLPEIYQDIFIKGETIKKGVRECDNRYNAIKPILASLPQKFKSLDIGASQGYFSFRMAHEFNARCTMVEDSYTITNSLWRTGEYLRYLCEQNSSLKNITLLQTKVYAKDLIKLKKTDTFDVVLAFSVIHHMRKHETDHYVLFGETIDALLDLAPVVIIENPINTGEHTHYIREELLKRDGKCIYQSPRGNLIYEIYLFDRRTIHEKKSLLENLSSVTYKAFNGTYQS
ncbi:MAG: hypothetical protein WD512_04925 [Candidatus Paceibacterota bacterium]